MLASNAVGGKQPRLRDYSPTAMSRARDAMGLGSSNNPIPTAATTAAISSSRKSAAPSECSYTTRKAERADQHIYHIGEVSPPIQIHASPLFFIGRPPLICNKYRASRITAAIGVAPICL